MLAGIFHIIILKASDWKQKVKVLRQMLRTLLILIEHFKLGILGFVIVMFILFTIYSHRIYSPQNMDATSDTNNFILR